MRPEDLRRAVQRTRALANPVDTIWIVCADTISLKSGSTSKSPPLKILHVDVETRPALAYVWRLYGNDVISVDQVKEPTGLLCFAAQWDHLNEVMFFSQYKHGHKNMVRKAHELLSTADVIVSYNGLAFDGPRINNEFLLYNLPPPPPIDHVDLKKTVMGKFDLTSSKLAFVGPALQIGTKVKNSGWDLWRGCLENDPASWAEMEKYNKEDVRLLKRLYHRVLPWIDNHPNMNLVVDETEPVCPNCGGKVRMKGLRRALTSVYQRYVCNSCGRWSRSRTRLKTEPTALVR